MLVFYCSLLETEHERKKMSEIYEEHKHALFMYALKIVGNNRAMAEDAVHNTFISIIKEKDKYFHLNCRDFRFSSVIIVRNKSIDLIRKEKHYSETAIEDLEIYIESKEKPVDELIAISSEYTVIRKHMEKIDEISRQVLILKYVFGMTYKEIGTRLDMTPKHIETRISRAKEKVRKLMEKENCKNNLMEKGGNNG